MSFLLRGDDPERSTAVELVTEIISQRLSNGFQICTPANAIGAIDTINLVSSKTIPDVLRDIEQGEGSAIYLSLADQIHRVAYDSRSHSVTVKISCRNTTWKKPNQSYGALIWCQDADNFAQSAVTFPYPTVQQPSQWQYLDSIVAGVEKKPELRSSLRFWRTRLVLLPSKTIPEREYLIKKTPAFEGGEVSDDDIQYQGFLNLISTLQGLRWVPPGGEREPTDVHTYVRFSLASRAEPNA
jgi:hypothetical protein